VIQNPDQFDLVLTDATAAGQIAAGKLAGPFSHAKVPNIKYIKPQYLKMYPWGLPTDFGVTGIVYRKDLVKEPIRSLADFWKIAPKYSGRIVIMDWDRQTMGIALRYLGYNSNTRNDDQMEKARDALLSLKKHVLAFTPATATAKKLTGKNPEAVLGISFDFDAGLFQPKQPNLVFVPPSEGMVGYIEGWQAIKTTKHLDEVYALMNFHARPRVTADFLKVSGTAPLGPAAAKLLPKAPQALRLPASAYAKTQFAVFIGAKPLASITRYYQQVKSG
jgi:spermidine/putrescine transport system substrate-binding protein